MDRQDVFNRVYKRAVSMEKPAYINGSCMYRSKNGPCLIGSLITDEAYHKVIEHCGASDPCVIEALEKSGVNVENESDKKFLCVLQSAHDNNVSNWNQGDWSKIGKETMLEELRQIALFRGLEIPNVDLV